jgi:hypothetical protein
MALALGSHRRNLSAVPLSFVPAFVGNQTTASSALLSTQRAAPGDPSIADAAAASGRRPVVVGTVRMGYGHQRIAAAAASWLSALSAGETGQPARKPARPGDAAKPAARGGGGQGGAGVGTGAEGVSVVMHDLTGLESAEAALIIRADRCHP